MEMTSAPAPEPQAPISHFGRIFGVLFNPKPTFAEIVRRPSWIAPLALLMILGTAAGALLNEKVNWADYIRHEAEKNTRFAQLSPEQKESTISSQAKLSRYLVYGSGIVNMPVLVLFFALFFWGVFALFFGASLRFGTAFGIVAHAFFPFAITLLLSLVVLPLKSYGDVDPQNVVATNLAAFLGDEAPKWLASLGSSLDVLWIWCLVLLAVGFAASNPKKIKPGAAYATVFGIWALWVLAKVGWALL